MELTKLEINLIKDINDSKLPIDAAFFVVKSVYEEMVKVYKNYIAQENMEAIKEASQVEIIEKNEDILLEKNNKKEGEE